MILIPLAIVEDFELGVFIMPRHGCLCSVNELLFILLFFVCLLFFFVFFFFFLFSFEFD